MCLLRLNIWRSWAHSVTHHSATVTLAGRYKQEWIGWTAHCVFCIFPTTSRRGTAFARQLSTFFEVSVLPSSHQSPFISLVPLLSVHATTRWGSIRCEGLTASLRPFLFPTRRWGGDEDVVKGGVCVNNYFLKMWWCKYVMKNIRSKNIRSECVTESKDIRQINVLQKCWRLK